MTVADDVLRALQARPTGMTDEDLARLLGKNHSHINQVCHRLADQGHIIRDAARGDIVNKMPGDATVPQAPAASQDANVSGMREWAWEGNVQSRVATYLAADGWSIIRVADTARRERGADIIAQRGGQQLLVEVKGWPSTTYARGERAGQPKPTQPGLQAAHWFGEALTSLIRRGAEHGTCLALGLPDMPRYRALLGDASWALERLDITVYLVPAEGTVEIWKREN
jgi:Holliday junction resolvase-like predicted endonuclease